MFRRGDIIAHKTIMYKLGIVVPPNDAGYDKNTDVCVNWILEPESFRHIHPTFDEFLGTYLATKEEYILLGNIYDSTDA